MAAVFMSRHNYGHVASISARIEKRFQQTNKLLIAQRKHSPQASRNLYHFHELTVFYENI